MESVIENKILEALNNKKTVKYGKLFTGLTPRKIKWRIVKFSKHNESSTQKQFVLDGYYYGIYIGQALMVIEGDAIEIDFMSVDGRK